MAYADSSAATELGTEFRDHRQVVAALEALSEEDLGRLGAAEANPPSNTLPSGQRSAANEVSPLNRMVRR